MSRLLLAVLLSLAPPQSLAGAPGVGPDAGAASPASVGEATVAVRDTARIRVMVLGVWHFAGGTNVIEAKPARIMEPRRQRELGRVLDALAEFRPTKVAVEEVVEEPGASELDSLYRAYRAGEREVAAREDEQIGFRIAERMGLERVHGIDHKIPWPHDTLVVYARARDPSYLDYMERHREQFLATMDSLREHATVGGILRWFNAPETVGELLAPYMRMAEVGVEDGWVGVKPVANYYRRNLRIFANLTRIVDPGDRVLVVYGAGHQPFLEEFVEGHAQMELVSPLPYLDEVPASAASTTGTEDQPESPVRDTTADRPAPREGPKEIVLLGTSHFAGSALDEHSSEVGDVLSDERQLELDRIAARVAEFGPDRVFLECDKASQSTFDSLYAAYVAGDHDPTVEGVRNERQQLGFRMANRAGVGGVTCADAFGVWLGAQARRVAREHSPAWLDSLESYPRPSDAEYLADHSLGEYLRWMNTDSLLYGNYQVYNRYFVRMGSFEGTERKLSWEGDLGGAEFVFAGDLSGFPVGRATRILESIEGRVVEDVSAETSYLVRGGGVSDATLQRAREHGVEVLTVDQLQRLVAERAAMYVGFPDHYIGADLVAEWQKRNLRIYANLLRAMDREGERAVVLMGQAHVWPLRELFRANPRFEVVPVRDVL